VSIPPLLHDACTLTADTLENLDGLCRQGWLDNIILASVTEKHRRIFVGCIDLFLEALASPSADGNDAAEPFRIAQASMQGCLPALAKTPYDNLICWDPI